MILTVNGSALHGTVPAIPSKSACHRALICAALSEGITEIRCEASSEDISATAASLKKLGAEISYTGGNFYISGGHFHQRAKIDVSQSGSTLRFLLPVIAASGTNASVTMQGRLPLRPISPLTDELRSHGAVISKDGENPIIISGRLRGGFYTLPGDISSQFISGLLFALPLCHDDSTVTVCGGIQSESYIKMTADTLSQFGISVIEKSDGFYIPGGQTYKTPGKLSPEGDWSAAAFWLAVGSFGKDVTVSGLSRDTLQGDREITNILEKLKGEGNILIDAKNIPDLVPVIAVCASTRKGNTVIYNAGRLRCKESDRLETTTEMLKALGGKVRITEDGLKILPSVLHSGTVESAGDHRIAMAAAVASAVAGNVTVRDAECVSKSYPSFWQDFKKLNGTVYIEK